MLQHWPLASLSLVGTLWIGPLFPVTASEPVAQAPFSNMNQVERLNNPDWQTIPGAEVGRHPAETLMDINGIVRDGNTVTFDVTGYRGFYYRMAGDCETDRIVLTRRGRSEGIDEFLYESVESGDMETSDWNRRLLTYACQSSDDLKQSSQTIPQRIQDLPDGQYFFEAPQGTETYNTPSGNLEFFFQKQGDTVTGIAIFHLAHNSCFRGEARGNSIVNLTWGENEISGRTSRWSFSPGQPLDLGEHQKRPYDEGRFSVGTSRLIQGCVEAFSNM